MVLLVGHKMLLGDCYSIVWIKCSRKDAKIGTRMQVGGVTCLCMSVYPAANGLCFAIIEDSHFTNFFESRGTLNNITKH